MRNNLFDSLLSNPKFPNDIKTALGELEAFLSCGSAAPSFFSLVSFQSHACSELFQHQTNNSSTLLGFLLLSVPAIIHVLYQYCIAMLTNPCHCRRSIHRDRPALLASRLGWQQG